jgi:acetoin utilization deacetylase AcuC-like enzyme
MCMPRGRIVSVLEGGYNVVRLAECAGVRLQTLVE